MSTKNVFYKRPHQASCLKQGKKKLCKDCAGLNCSGVISHTANKSIHPNCDHNCPVYAVTDFESFPYSKKRTAVTSGPIKCTTSNTHPKVMLKEQEKGSEVNSETNKESDLVLFKDDGSETSSDTETRIIDQLVPKTKVDQHHSTMSINHASLPTKSASIQREKRAASGILCIANTSSCRGGNGPRTKFQVSTSADDRKTVFLT
ncbi:hypothetical protein DFH28DRAFT_939989 [Melampsora americana]|nr:hypothetical protein DFH28DRAFT_939989 [Melampsora americana]